MIKLKGNVVKALLTLILVGFTLLLSLIIANWGQIKPILGVYKEAIFSKIDIDYINAKKKLAEEVKSNAGKSINETIDFTRALVYENSIHKEDKEHDSYAFNKQAVTKKIWQAIKGGEKPHLSCGPRVYAMKDILIELNIQSRVVDVIYSNDLKSHTVLEVYNHEINRWQIHDPDNNSVLKDKYNNRLSAVNVLTKSNVGVFNKQIIAVLIREAYDGKQNSLFYNPDLFKMNTDISNKYNSPAVFLMTKDDQHGN